MLCASDVIHCIIECSIVLKQVASEQEAEMIEVDQNSTFCLEFFIVRFACEW